jgi:hypothetical protein
MHTRPSLTLGMNMLLSQECSLCRQPIHAETQLPLSAILIEGFRMCPNCHQCVGPKTEESYEYRAKWLRRVRGISRKKGWGWEYRPGDGFRRKEEEKPSSNATQSQLRKQRNRCV